MANGPMLKKPKIMEPCLQFRECGSCARFYSSLFYFNFYFILIYLFHLLHLLYLIQFSSLWFRVPIFLDLLRKTAGALPKFWFILVNSILFISIEVYSSLFKPIQVYSKFRVWLRVRWATGRGVTGLLRDQDR